MTRKPTHVTKVEQIWTLQDLVAAMEKSAKRRLITPIEHKQLIRETINTLKALGASQGDVMAEVHAAYPQPEPVPTPQLTEDEKGRPVPVKTNTPEPEKVPAKSGGLFNR